MHKSMNFNAIRSLLFSACKRPKPSIFTNNVAVLVNKVTMLDSPSPVPVTGTTYDTWTDFADVNLGCVELKAGKNEIKLAIMDSNASAGYNINNISFKSALPLTVSVDLPHPLSRIANRSTLSISPKAWCLLNPMHFLTLVFTTMSLIGRIVCFTLATV